MGGPSIWWMTTVRPWVARHFVFYNRRGEPSTGIRRGVIPETRSIASMLLKNGIQTITFARSRLTVEVLTKYLKDLVRDPLGNAGRVRGYRGGYLPTGRREIEKGLRAGSIDAVVSTNALELGIDIGALDACVLCGYPGTIASACSRQAAQAAQGNEHRVLCRVLRRHRPVHPGTIRIISSPQPEKPANPDNRISAQATSSAPPLSCP